ncbi:MAG: carbon-nitrogen hydrolase family protein [Thermoplasmatota archaeon]
MSSKLKVACVQLNYKDGLESYYSNISNIVNNLILKDTDILCFPESCIHGFDYGVLSNLKKREIQKQIQFFKDLAEGYNVHVIAGLIEKTRGKYYDSVMTFQNDGELIHTYRKVHLWDKEKDFFTPGSSIGLFDIEGWKIGLGLCADLGFPEFSRSAALNGAEFLIFPSAWREPYDKLWKQMITARAGENQAYVVGINALGSKDDYCGKTVAIDPSGETIGELEKKEDVLFIEIDKQKVLDRRKEIDWLSMVKPEVYQKKLNVRTDQRNK